MMPASGNISAFYIASGEDAENLQISMYIIIDVFICYLFAKLNGPQTSYL